MGLKLQGLAAKLAKLEHDAEFEAGKLDAKVEGETARMPGVFSGAHQFVDTIAQRVSDIGSAFGAIEQVTSNGGPPINPPSPPPAPAVTPLPEPPSPLASGAPSQTQPLQP